MRHALPEASRSPTTDRLSYSDRQRLRSCAVVEGKGRGGHLGRIGQWFGKVLYRGFIEEFPDLVSEVSTGSARPTKISGASELCGICGRSDDALSVKLNLNRGKLLRVGIATS